MAESELPKKSPLAFEYDIEAAVGEGLTAEDIAQYAASKTNYDYATARKSGLSDNDVIEYLVEGAKDRGLLRTVAEGFGRGAAQSLGFGLAAVPTFGGTLLFTKNPIAALVAAGGAGMAGMEVAKGLLPEEKQVLPEDLALYRGSEFGGMLTFGIPRLPAIAATSLIGKTRLPGATKAKKYAEKLAAGPVDLGAKKYLDMQAWTQSPASVINKNEGLLKRIFVSAPKSVAKGTAAAVKDPKQTLGRTLKFFEDTSTAARQAALKSPVTSTFISGSAVASGGAGYTAYKAINPDSEGGAVVAGMLTSVFGPLALVPVVAKTFSGKLQSMFSAKDAAGARKLFGETLGKDVTDDDITKMLAAVIEDLEAQAASTTRRRDDVTGELAPLSSENLGFDALQRAQANLANIDTQLTGAQKKVAEKTTAEGREAALKQVEELTARKTQAQQRISEIENIEFPDVPSLGATKNDFIQKLSQIIFKQDPELAEVARARFEEAAQQTFNLVSALRRTGDSELIRDAAKVETLLVQNALETALLNRQSQVDELVKKMRGAAGVLDIQESNLQMFNALDDLIKAARKAESDLYERLGEKELNSVKIDPEKTVEYYLELLSKKPADAVFPPRIKAFLREALGDLDPEPIAKEAQAQLTRAEKQAARANETIDDPLNTVPKNKMTQGIQDLNAQGKRLEVTPEELENIKRLIPGISNADASTVVELNLYNEFLKTRSASSKAMNFTSDKAGQQKVVKALVDKIKADTAVRRLKDEVNAPIINLQDSPRNMVSLKSLLDTRSELLAMSRSSSAGINANWNDARQLNEMAQAILEDIGLVTLQNKQYFAPGKRGTDVKFTDLPEDTLLKLQEAHSFSKSFNDVFSRAFPGKLLQRRANGEYRYSPELLSDQFKLGTTGGNVQLQELDEAIGFLRTFNPDDQAFIDLAAKSSETFGDGLRRFTKALLASKVIKLTGDPQAPYKFDLAAIQKIKDDPNFQYVLDRPEMQSLMKNLEDAEALQITVRDALTPRQEILKHQKDFDAFSFFLKNELKDPELFSVDQVLSSRIGKPFGGDLKPDNIKNLEALVEMAMKTKDKSVINGMVIAFLDKGFRESANNKIKSESPERFFNLFERYLFAPLGTETNKSIASILVEKGAVETLAPLRQLLNKGQRFSELANKLGTQQRVTPDEKNSLMQITGMAHLAIAKILGLSAYKNFANSVRNVGIPLRDQGLVEAQIVSGQIERTLSKVPAASAQDLIAEIVLNPKKMADLLRNFDDVSSTQSKTFLQNWVDKLGVQSPTYITPTITAYGRSGEQETLPQAPPQEMPQAAAPAPRPTAPQPAMQMPAEPAVPLPQAPPPASPDQRQQYAAMYPFDTVSELIRTGRG